MCDYTSGSHYEPESFDYCEEVVALAERIVRKAANDHSDWTEEHEIRMHEAIEQAQARVHPQEY